MRGDTELEAQLIPTAPRRAPLDPRVPRDRVPVRSAMLESSLMETSPRVPRVITESTPSVVPRRAVNAHRARKSQHR